MQQRRPAVAPAVVPSASSSSNSRTNSNNNSNNNSSNHNNNSKPSPPSPLLIDVERAGGGGGGTDLLLLAVEAGRGGGGGGGGQTKARGQKQTAPLPKPRSSTVGVDTRRRRKGHAGTFRSGGVKALFRAGSIQRGGAAVTTMALLVVTGCVFLAAVALAAVIVLMVRRDGPLHSDIRGGARTMSFPFWTRHGSAAATTSETWPGGNQRPRTTTDAVTPRTALPPSLPLHRSKGAAEAAAATFPRRRPAAEPRNPLSELELAQPEQLIDMRELNYALPYDNVDGGAWKQGWAVKPSIKPQLRIFVVPHSHCDPGWIKTFDAYFREQTSAIISTVVAALLVDSRRTFVWAEISYFSWWWDEQRDEGVRASVRRLLANGQLEFVTGGWVQPDEANSELYAMEVQLQEGHDWIRATLGAAHVPAYGWSIDPFGYSPTAAYLWKKYQFRGMLIQRVHYAVKKRLAERGHLEFFWRQTWERTATVADDVSGQRIQPHDIFTHVMPFFSYDVPHTCGPDPAVCCQFDFGRLPAFGRSCPWHQPPVPITPDNVRVRAELLLDQYRKKAALYRSSAVLAPLGDDFRYQTPREAEAQYSNYQLIFDYINEHVPGVEIQFGTLSDYFRAARETFDGPVPILKGSFFTYADVNEDYWSGYYTSRAFDKALDRQLERALYAAESMGVAKEGKNTRLALQSPRRALSLFQHHDGVTGTAQNHVVEDYARRMYEAIAVTQQWMITSAPSLGDLLKLDASQIQPCWVSTAPRTMNENRCEKAIVVYNPLDEEQRCGSILVGGRQFAKATLPCEVPGPAQSSKTKFVFDAVSGLMKEPIREEWKVWKVKSGGAYLFVPGEQDAYDLSANNLRVEQGGFVVTTTFWKRTVVEREVSKKDGRTSTAIDFIYETDLLAGNQEWFVRFSGAVDNRGYFHTDLNGFDFDTHRFRKDMPIQSQVFPMPTLASIQDDHVRLTVLSEHAQGTASLQDGSIDVWLDRRLDQDDNRGLGQGVQDNRRTRTRLRVLLESDGYDPAGEFDVSPFGRRMWDELQHPLEMFGQHAVRTVQADSKKRLVEDAQTGGLSERKGDEERVRNLRVPFRAIEANNHDAASRIRTVTSHVHAAETTIVPFVFMVYTRVEYLKSAVAALRKSDFPRDRVPLIISHDGRVPAVVAFVESIRGDFPLLIQLFHPHACYDHPYSFPGNDTRLNDGYKGDAFHNPRSPWATCCKHHFTWLLTTVFSRRDLISQSVDTFLFLEEDYIVAPTIYQAIVGGLNAMDEFANETMENAFLGLCLDPTEGNRKGLRPIVDADAWYGATFLSGPMTLHRSTFAKLHEHAASYCGRDGFDEYNWDWSFVHMQEKGLLPHTVLLPSLPLAKHIGIENGMHLHGQRMTAAARYDFERLDSRFFGTKMVDSPRVPLLSEHKQGYGGWGHPADQDHCMKLLFTAESATAAR